MLSSRFGVLVEQIMNPLRGHRFAARIDKTTRVPSRFLAQPAQARRSFAVCFHRGKDRSFCLYPMTRIAGTGCSVTALRGRPTNSDTRKPGGKTEMEHRSVTNARAVCKSGAFRIACISPTDR